MLSRRPVVAAEAHGGYGHADGPRHGGSGHSDPEHGAPRAASDPEGPDADAPWSAATLDAAVDVLASVDVDGLDRDGLQRLLVEMSGPLRRLEAVRTRLVGALRRREAAGNPSPHAGQREAREFLRHRLGLSPSDAKQTVETAKALDDTPDTDGAYQRGTLTLRHAAVITGCLPHIPEAHRAEVEAELLGLAGRVDPTVLGRRARALIAAHDTAEACTLETLERRRHARRRFTFRRADDGGLAFSGLLFGADAETVETAFAAFTPTPTADDLRSHDQRRADGLATLADAVLAAGKAPAQHGVRPQVLVMCDADQLAAWQAGHAGTVTFGSGEHASFEEARYLLADCVLTRIVLDADRAPLEASVAARTVPVGLWRALQARDGGCTWDGCDAPAAWCDVAHLDVPFAAEGRLTPQTAGLLCRRHHRRYDAGGWAAHITGGKVVYQADPDRPPVRTLIHRYREDEKRGQSDPPPGTHHPLPAKPTAGPPAETGGSPPDPGLWPPTAEPPGHGQPRLDDDPGPDGHDPPA